MVRTGRPGEAQLEGLRDVVRITLDDEVPSVPRYLVWHREARGVEAVRVVVRRLETALKRALR